MDNNKVDKKTFSEALGMFQKFTKKDKEDIDEKSLMNMNKGPVNKIWFQVMKLWNVVNDPKSTKVSKALGIGALLYLISPIDAIPDIIPVLGLTDDVSIILYAINQLTKKK